MENENKILGYDNLGMIIDKLQKNGMLNKTLVNFLIDSDNKGYEIVIENDTFLFLDKGKVYAIFDNQLNGVKYGEKTGIENTYKAVKSENKKIEIMTKEIRNIIKEIKEKNMDYIGIMPNNKIELASFSFDSKPFSNTPICYIRCEKFIEVMKLLFTIDNTYEYIFYYKENYPLIIQGSGYSGMIAPVLEDW